MKKIIYLLTAGALLISTSSYALIFNSGPYLGGQIGSGGANEGDGYKNYFKQKSSYYIKKRWFCVENLWRL